jgi:hypothetical protein
MQKLKWHSWEVLDGVPVGLPMYTNLLLDTDHGYVAAKFKKNKKDQVVGSINGAYWFDQKITKWANLEGVL